MMKIAVIDSGINLEYEDFKDVSIETIGIGKAYKYIKDKNGHGTSTIGEIVNINPKAEIIVFKALDENKRCSLLTVINILKYCMSRNDISIINMSLSCVIYDEEVFKYGSRIIKKLLNKKIKIVASVANNMDYIHNERNFPSDVEGVIKVKHIYSPKQYIEFDRRNMIYTYYGSYNLMPTKNNNYLFYKGNSSFTARISGLLSLNLNVLEMNEFISNDSKKAIGYISKEVLKRLIKRVNGTLDINKEWTVERYILLFKEIENISKQKIDYKKICIEDLKNIECFSKKIIEG